MSKVQSPKSKVLVMLWLATSMAVAEPTAYMDMVLRARNAAEARDRLGVTGGSFTQTNISYTAVTNAPWQWGSLNLTNWSALGTNALTNYVRFADLVARTNWTRQLTWSKTIYIGAATFDSNNVLATWTADGNPWRIDTTRILSTPDLPGVNDYEEHIGVFWTNAVGDRMDFLLTDNYNGDIVATTGFNHYIRQHTYLVNAPSGNVVTITNRARVTTADRNAGTNHLYFEVSKPQLIYGVQP